MGEIGGFAGELVHRAADQAVAEARRQAGADPDVAEHGRRARAALDRDQQDVAVDLGRVLGPEVAGPRKGPSVPAGVPAPDQAPQRGVPDAVEDPGHVAVDDRRHRVFVPCRRLARTGAPGAPAGRPFAFRAMRADYAPMRVPNGNTSRRRAPATQPPSGGPVPRRHLA